MKDFKSIQNKPMEELRNVRLNLSLSRLIVNKPGLVGCHINGTQQSGKSSYALMVLYELYRGDIDKVLKHVVFSIKDLTELLNSAIQNDKRLLCVLWDDSSVHGGAGLYNINRQLVQYLSAMGDTLGLATKSILLTSPSGDIIKAFRNYNFYKVHVGFGRHKYDRTAKGYEFGMSPFGQKWGKIAFKDDYDVRIPFYERYYELRKQLSVSTLSDMNTFLETSQKQQEEDIVRKPMKKELVAEIYRDYDAGVFGSDVTLKHVFEKKGIDYGYARNCKPKVV